ncbi:hypothetical protein DSECCO2_653950 [anaerobic digester metagenome]
MLMHRCRHFIIQRSHHLFRHLHDGNADAFLMKVFRHFQADESCPHDHSVMHIMLLDVILDSIRIRHITQSEDQLILDPGNGRAQGLRSGR